MPELRDSVKCKYCCHFQPGSNRCKRGGHSTATRPDHVCKSFMLSPSDVIFEKVMRERGEPARRGDGSYITSMPQFMLDEFEEAERKESFREGLVIALILGVGLLILWLIFGPFIIAVWEMISGVLDFLS